MKMIYAFVYHSEPTVPLFSVLQQPSEEKKNTAHVRIQVLSHSLTVTMYRCFKAKN